MRFARSEKIGVAFLIVVVAPVAALWINYRRGAPLENALRAYVGKDAVDCGKTEIDDEPNTREIAGCVAMARRIKKPFFVRRDFQAGERWSTAIAGFPDGRTATFYISRAWKTALIINHFAPDRKYRWNLDLEDMRDHQLKLHE